VKSCDFIHNAGKEKKKSKKEEETDNKDQDKIITVQSLLVHLACS